MAIKKTINIFLDEREHSITKMHEHDTLTLEEPIYSTNERNKNVTNDNSKKFWY